MATTNKKDVSEEYAETRERVEQEIREIDKSITKLTKRKAELEALVKPPTQ